MLHHWLYGAAEFLKKKLPVAIEEGLYDKEMPRKRGESMLQYCTRRKTLFRKLEKEGWKIPDEPKGYLLLRDAHLPDKARDLVEMWTGGIYNYPEMQMYLKRLERPIPGNGGQRITGLTAFEMEEEQTANYINVDNSSGSDGTISLTFMQESLFVIPEAFDEELLQEAYNDLDNPEIIYVAGDLDDECILEEDESIAILANYGQVRQ